MPDYSKQIVYLSQAQYQELITNGTITVDGVTVTYNENDIYVTPQAEPVTDVRVNGTSISSGGVANIPVASASTFGVAKANYQQGIGIASNGELQISIASDAEMKAGSNGLRRPITPSNQEKATFYGLAKAAGHDEASSTEAFGTYTDAAKGSIQQMLGVSSLLAPTEPTLVASKAYAVGDVFTANGKLYKVTTAIAAAETIVVQNEGETVSEHNAEETSLSDGFVKWTDYADSNNAQTQRAGIIGLTPVWSGVRIVNGAIHLNTPNAELIKQGTDTSRTTLIHQQHLATFYGLAKAAGDTTQSQSSNAVGTYTDEAKAAIRTMVGAVGNEDYATASNYGIVKLGGGLTKDGNGFTVTDYANSSVIKTGSGNRRPITPAFQHESVFYGLAAAAGDTTQKTASTFVGTYTDSAKASIKSMLGIVDGSTGTVSVSGTTPTITAVENTRYVCGEVATLTITPPASGICIIRFTSGTTATVLTATGVVWPEWFDATALEASRVYEICITDGYGMVMSWAL